MKRIFVIILILCLFASSALASTPSTFAQDYNRYAGVYGAPVIVSEETQSGNKVYKTGGDLFFAAQENASGKIDTVYIYCNAKEEEGDFLCACLTAMTIFEQPDMDACGTLLSHFAFAKKGKPFGRMAYTHGMNSFSIGTLENCRYFFVLAIRNP